MTPPSYDGTLARGDGSYARGVGSSGPKRRKPRRRLPKVQGRVAPGEPNAATALSPAGVPQVYGNIARAARDRRGRASGTRPPASVLIGLMLAVAAIIVVVAFLTR